MDTKQKRIMIIAFIVIDILVAIGIVSCLMKKSKNNTGKKSADTATEQTAEADGKNNGDKDGSSVEVTDGAGEKTPTKR